MMFVRGSMHLLDYKELQQHKDKENKGEDEEDF